MTYYNNRSFRTGSIPFSNPHDKKPKRLNVREYLKNEFFNCDDIIFKRIATLYRSLYGVSAYNYMMNTFYSWKSGATGISGQTFGRILQCVPKFLSDEKRFYILKCEVVYFLDTLSYNQQSKSKNAQLSEINLLFSNYKEEIENFDKSNLSWFIGNGIFSERELEQFLFACKYAINKKLNLSVQQVYDDLHLINEKVSFHNIDNVDSTYRIDFLNTIVDLKQIKKTNLISEKFADLNVNLDGTFRLFAERYILDELIKIDLSQKQGAAHAFIKANDLDTVLMHYNETLKGKEHFEISSTFQGQGGTLYLNLSYTPLNITIQEITIASFKLLGLMLCECTFLYLWINKNPLGVILAFYGGIFLLVFIFNELRNIKKSIIQYRRNG